MRRLRDRNRLVVLGRTSRGADRLLDAELYRDAFVMDLVRYPLAGISDDELLTRIMEESGEVVQAAAKCQNLFAELKDVEALTREFRKSFGG